MLPAGLELHGRLGAAAVEPVAGHPIERGLTEIVDRVRAEDRVAVGGGEERVDDGGAVERIRGAVDRVAGSPPSPRSRRRRSGRAPARTRRGTGGRSRGRPAAAGSGRGRRRSRACRGGSGAATGPSSASETISPGAVRDSEAGWALGDAGVVEELGVARRSTVARSSASRKPATSERPNVGAIRAVATRRRPSCSTQSAPAAPCAESPGITRPKVRSPLGWVSGSSSSPGKSSTRSSAELAGETCSSGRRW